ncbi:MAG TPA: hypothetical protein DCE41_31260 [Cytophagales bacterium]|nr:hypothetical protein [Cytophagales bacterium]HAA22398.1 hypothetical protein [Cytophagales bacterium]HAP59970.1 hypothetical protein [Cytophagales bacterium]
MSSSSNLAIFPNDNVLGVVGRFIKSPVNFLKEMEAFEEPITKFRLGPEHMYYLKDQDLVDELMKNWKVAQKNANKAAVYAIGNGVIFSEGDEWKHQRRVLAPAFHRKSIQGYMDAMYTHADNYVTLMQEHHQQSPGTPFELGDAMYDIAIRVVRDSLFGTDNDDDELAVVLEGMRFLFQYTTIAANPLYPPLWFPTATNRKVHRYYRQIKEITQRTIDSKRNKPEDGSLISMLLADNEDGSPKLDADNIIDQVKVMFVAGTETTSNTMAFVLYELARNPEWGQKLKDEVRSVLGKRAISFEDFKQLPILKQVLNETLRLYPPAWMNVRRLGEEATLAGVKIPKKARIWFSSYWVHRKPELWENPEAFDPGRFEPGKPVSPYYSPFLLGPRRCIGDQFALTEATVVLATLLQHFDFSLPENGNYEINFGATLGFKEPLKMVAKPVF